MYDYIKISNIIGLCLNPLFDDIESILSILIHSFLYFKSPHFGKSFKTNNMLYFEGIRE